MSFSLWRRRPPRSKHAVALFTEILALSIALPLPLLSAAAPEDSLSSPQPGRFAKQLTLGVLDTLLLFDHVLTKSRTVTSPAYLDRVAGPQSQFHATYVSYQHGQISQENMVQSLPHIALLGDSLSKHVYVSPGLGLLWRARTEERRNWFLDTDPSPNSIYSVYERINELTPLVASDYARGAAEVTAQSWDETLIKTLARTRNFTRQVNQVLQPKRFPDLVLIWIGHNNLNWVKGLPLNEREHPEKYLRERARRFHDDYSRQMRRLIARAGNENHKVAVIVFGLADCETFFKARQQAEALHATNRKAYPYCEVCCTRYESLKPKYQENMTRLGVMLNSELRSMVADLNRDIKDHPNLRLEYSTAFTKMDLSRLELLHPMDAQHLSTQGHNFVATTAFAALSPSLEFLEIPRNPAKPSRHEHNLAQNQIPLRQD